jgi:nitrite reductase/ring-hydroxylating ferredoxin subunit
MEVKRLRLCHLDDLPIGDSKGFDPYATGQDSMFIVRQHHALRAYQNNCPHWPGSSMAWRKDAYLSPDRKHILCYGHGAHFDIESGNCESGPCLGQSLKHVDLLIEQDGNVYLLPEDKQYVSHQTNSNEIE